MNQDPTAIVIALYAAVLSSLVFVWNVITWRINRGKIKFQCRAVFVIDLERAQIEYKVINTGEKPITITGFGYTRFRNNGKHMGEGQFIVQNMPHRLEGHSSFIHHRQSPDIFHFGVNHKTMSVYAEDALGKRYKLSRRVIKKMLKTHAKNE